MKIGIVGQTYSEASLPFDAQRTINLYPVIDQQGREPTALYSVPGLVNFATAGFGPGRKAFRSQNGRAFVVSGSSLYEVFENGTTTVRGALLQSSGNLTVAENPSQLAICDGQELFIFTYATNSFAQVTDVDLPAVVASVTFMDGYFIIVEGNSGRFYISALNDGTSWDALDFATAETSPDNLVLALRAGGQLWLLGKTTTEVWSNTGSSDFPFRRISGANLEVGLLAVASAVELDNAVFLLGGDSKGRGIVYRTSGLTPERISTPAIEQVLQRSGDLETCVAYGYQQDGRWFYVLTGGGLQTSFVYDLTTKLWHERAQLSETGEYGQHIVRDHMFAFDKHLGIDYRNGNIYEFSTDAYDNAGEVLSRERVTVHVGEEDQRTRYSRLTLNIEAGVGLQSGQGEDPLVSLRVSKDGAKTWSDWFDAPIGRVGEYRNKATFRRLGVAEQMTFNVRITDPVKVAILGAYLS